MFGSQNASFGRGRTIPRNKEWKICQNRKLDFRPVPYNKPILSVKPKVDNNDDVGSGPDESKARKTYKSDESSSESKGHDNYNDDSDVDVKCKLPRTYSYGIYEEVPKWVEKQKPLPIAQIDTTDWSDKDDVKAFECLKPVPVIKADGGNNFFMSPDEKLVDCPYDVSHKILENRFMRHLSKCRNNYVKKMQTLEKKPEIIVCKYDLSHHIKDSLMVSHLKTCQKALEYFDYKKKTEEHYKQSQAKLQTNGAGNSGGAGKPSASAQVDISQSFFEEENWDLLKPVKSYDPSAKIKEGCLFYIPQGLTKSERKKYRAEVRARFAEKERLEELEKIEKGEASEDDQE